MLADEPKAVELYVKRKRDRWVRSKKRRSHSSILFSELYQWWARYLESTGDADGARNYYKYADDQLAVVRMLCDDDRVNEVSRAKTEICIRVLMFVSIRRLSTNVARAC